MIMAKKQAGAEFGQALVEFSLSFRWSHIYFQHSGCWNWSYSWVITTIPGGQAGGSEKNKINAILNSVVV